MARDVTEPAIPFADDPATWRRYDGFVRRLALRLLGDASAADDVAQQVWQAALQRGPRVSGAWPAWLRRVAMRLAGKRARGDRRRSAHEARAPRVEPSTSPAEIRAREETRRLVIEAVLALREPYRQAVILHYLEERSAREIAHRQSVPLETVRTRLKRALEQLRAELHSRRGDEWRSALVLLPLARRASSLAIPSGAWILVQHKVKVVAAVLVAVGVLVWWSVDSTRPREPTAPSSPPSMSAMAPALTSTTAPPIAPAERTPAAAPVAANTGSVLVRATWGMTETPAPGIAVSVDVFEHRPRELAWRVGITDALGECRIAGLPPGRASINAVSRDVAGNVDIVAGECVACRLALVSGLTVRGRVVDERGQPVADAAICVDSVDLRFSIELGRSDADGRFVQRGLGRAALGARAPGYAPSPFHMVGGDTEVELLLVLTRGGGTVQGTVLAPDGRPASGALLSLGERQFAGTLLPSGGYGRRAPPLRVLTDAHGRFVAEGLPVERTPVRASFVGAAPWSGDIETAAGSTTPLVVSLRASPVIEGIVRSDAGQPVPKAWVELAGQPPPFWERGTNVAADGSFRLDQLPVGEVVLRASDLGHAASEATLVLEAGQVLRWEPRLPQGRTIAGRVVEADGTAAQFVHVEAQTQRWNRTELTDAEGRFAFQHVDVARFERVSVVGVRLGEQRGRHVRLQLENVDVPERDWTLTLPARPQGSVSITGRIIDATGAPVTQAEVVVFRRGTIQGDHVEFDPNDGRFRGTCLTGSCLVSVRALGFGTVSLGPRVLRDGETWDIGTLRLAAPAQVVVRVVLDPGLEWPAAAKYGNGEPYLPVYAWLVDAEGHTRASWYMREPGRIELPAVAAGRYRLLVHGEDFASDSIDVLVEAGATHDLQVRLVRGTRHEFRAVFGAARPTWAEVEVLDPQGTPLVRVPLAVNEGGIGTATRRLVAAQCSARLWVDGVVVDEPPLTHTTTR